MWALFSFDQFVNEKFVLNYLLIKLFVEITSSDFFLIGEMYTCT